MSDKNWGGKREGAGRPRGTDKKMRSLRLTDAEYDSVRKYIKDRRANMEREQIGSKAPIYTPK